jgi:hypothetical protein
MGARGLSVTHTHGEYPHKRYIYICICIICLHVLAALASLERRNIRNGRLPLVRATRCVGLFVFAIKVWTPHFHCFKLFRPKVLLGIL